MQVKELVEKRNALRNSIQTLIRDFEEETHTIVESVRVSKGLGANNEGDFVEKTWIDLEVKF